MQRDLLSLRLAYYVFMPILWPKAERESPTEAPRLTGGAARQTGKLIKTKLPQGSDHWNGLPWAAMGWGSSFTHCLLSNEHENEIESSLPKLID